MDPSVPPESDKPGTEWPGSYPKGSANPAHPEPPGCLARQNTKGRTPFGVVGVFAEKFAAKSSTSSPSSLKDEPHELTRREGRR